MMPIAPAGSRPNFWYKEASGLAMRWARVICFPGTYSCMILCFASGLVTSPTTFCKEAVV
jgi:hypothetical protein